VNRLHAEYLRILEEYQDIKDEFITIVSDEDLQHTLPGSPSLGELCKQMGETEQSYINSFKPPYKLNFEYKHADAAVATSVGALAAWWANLDHEMKLILDAFTDEDLDSIRVGRGSWMVPIQQNLDIYKEALLIFCGKAWVHLHALGKKMPEQWEEWIG
jgi:hypothetical protein